MPKETGLREVNNSINLIFKKCFCWFFSHSLSCQSTAPHSSPVGGRTAPVSLFAATDVKTQPRISRRRKSLPHSHSLSCSSRHSSAGHNMAKLKDKRREKVSVATEVRLFRPLSFAVYLTSARRLALACAC